MYSDEKIFFLQKNYSKKMKPGNICWFEIPVLNLDRAIDFYSTILYTKIEKIIFIEKEYGIFDKNKHSIGGCLIVKENYMPGKSTILFFSVIDLSEVLINTIEKGGTIVIPKTLMKQVTSKGDTIIAQNLIDDNVGYYAEIIDSEGNHIGLYSNS